MKQDNREQDKLEQGLRGVGDLLSERMAPGEDFYEKLNARIARESRVVELPPPPRRGFLPRRLGIALAAAAAVAVMAMGGLYLHSSGTQAWEVSTQSTTDDSTILATLDSRRVHYFLGHDSTVTVRAADRVVLEQGEVWVNVRHRSGHFAVETPGGTINVTGTAFGVRVADGMTSVFLANGGVNFVAEGGATTTMESGQLLAAGPAGTSLTAVAHGAEPVWVKTLYEGFNIAYTGMYFPSAGK